MIAPTCPELSANEPTLYVAFEVGKRDWKLAMTSGFGVTPWVRTVRAGDLAAVERAFERASAVRVDGAGGGRELL